MKTTWSSKARSLILVVSLSASIGFLSPAYGQVFDASYLIDLNTKEWTKLETLGEFTSARAINDSGQVVGQTGQGIWEVSSPYIRTGFITGPNGAGIRALGGVDATDINNVGQVVGISSVAPDIPFSEAYISGPNGGGGTLIKPLSEYSRSTQAYGINKAGQVAGQSLAVSSTGEGSSHAFITGPNGVGTIDLGFYGSATDINNKGRAAGGGSEQAFITGPNGVGMTDLGTLGGGHSYASGINDSGQVVGSSETAAGSRHAFVTGPNGTGMTDLNSLVDLPKGVILSSAPGINNVGQVIAIAMIPEPSSYALMLAGLALVGVVIRRKEVG